MYIVNTIYSKLNIVNIIKKIVNSAANLVKCVMPERVHCKAFLV